MCQACGVAHHLKIHLCLLVLPKQSVDVVVLLIGLKSTIVPCIVPHVHQLNT
jgi:hypothetical protein